jgi:hypothetical protein
MMVFNGCGISGRNVLFPLFLLVVVVRISVSAESCSPGHRPLFISVDSTATGYTPPGFFDRLELQLRQPLDEIGYCMIRFSPAVLSDSSVLEEQVMAISMRITVSAQKMVSDTDSTIVSDTAANMAVALVPISEWTPRNVRQTLENPLVSLEYHPDELATFESVLIRKIVENLRTQYICFLRITSVPDGVTIRSQSGLEGTTPLEWITPVGKLSISGELKGYEPLHRKINLTEPGNHTYILEMSKRRFYHSKLFIPTIALGVVSAGCFAADRIVYNHYSSLGRDDRGKTPDRFTQTFTIAKNLERAAAVTGTLAGVSLACCFFF